MRSIKSLILAQAVLLVGVGVGACASSSHTQVPRERLAASEASVRAAEEAGANTKDEAAALHLRMAREEMQSARQLIDKGNERRAETMLIRARADADLAQALAMASTTKAAAEKMRGDIRELKETTPSLKPGSETSPGATPPVGKPIPNREEAAHQNDEG